MSQTSVASSFSFHNFAGLLERIEKARGNDVKKKILSEFIWKWRENITVLSKEDQAKVSGPMSFFPAMRLLLPASDSSRDAYGLKETSLAKNYVEILGLGINSVDGKKLLNFKTPKSGSKDSGDFASVAYPILKCRCCAKGTLTIEEVNTCLDQLSLSSKNPEQRKKVLQKMLREMSAIEQKWLIRIVNKDLKIGLSQISILGLFHPDAEDLYNVKMNLETVCIMLNNVATRLHEIEVELMSPFRPMLGDRLDSSAKIGKLFENREFFIETKYDGERMQIHRRGDEYKIFSRGGHDYTKSFGSDAFSGTLIPYIDNCFCRGIGSCIVDGEMLGFDPSTQCLISKAESFDVKNGQQDKYQVIFCAFDVLEHDGKVLSGLPLRQRLEILKEVLSPAPGRLMISEVRSGNSVQDGIDALDVAIQNHEEGIMIKDPDSVYRPNTRTAGWYKMKPDYVQGLSETLDILVVGGYFGSGKNANLLSHFLCGVSEKREGQQYPTIFHSFCKIGSGYSKLELRHVNIKLRDKWHKFSRSEAPDWLKLTPPFRQAPDVWIDPKDSVILQVKAAEVMQSDQFATGCTLRFPRAEKFRDDKQWHECLSAADLEELRGKSGGRLALRLAADAEEPPKKKRARAKPLSRAVKPQLAAHFRGVDQDTITKESDVLSGREVCVINGSGSHDKAELERMILSLGGSIAQNPGQNTFCVIAENVNVKVKNIAKTNKHDVVKSTWLLRCASSEHFQEICPADVVHASLSTQRRFENLFDDFGDSYTREINKAELKDLLTKMKEPRAISPGAMADLEEELFGEETKHGLFRLCCAYIDNCLVIGEKETKIPSCDLDLTSSILQFYGGTVSSTCNLSVTHVIVSSSDKSRMEMFHELNRRRDKKFHIVPARWISESIAKVSLLRERDFLP